MQCKRICYSLFVRNVAHAIRKRIMPITVRITVIIACTIGMAMAGVAADLGLASGGFAVGTVSFFMSCLLAVLIAPRE